MLRDDEEDRHYDPEGAAQYWRWTAYLALFWLFVFIFIIK